VPEAEKRRAVSTVSRSVAPFPGAFLFGRFVSLFGRINSLFARVGNCLSDWLNINSLPAQDAS